jgi:nitrite reductase (NO-forming) / hydroxylamine reductase
MWISISSDASKPGETEEIVIYDEATHAEKIRVKDLLTHTGKSNAYNSLHDFFRPGAISPAAGAANLP